MYSYSNLSSFSFHRGVVSKLCNFFFSSRRRHTRWTGDWSSDVSLPIFGIPAGRAPGDRGRAGVRAREGGLRPVQRLLRDVRVRGEATWSEPAHATGRSGPLTS